MKYSISWKLNTGLLTAVLLTLPVLVYTAPKFDAAEVVTKTSTTAIKDIGTSISEMLVGTGKMSMYILSKANIIAGTDHVSVGIKRMKRDTDYTIDYAKGTISFASVIKNGDTIRIDYRYAGDGTPVRELATPSATALQFGSSKSNAAFSFGYRTADPNSGANGADIMTYGINTSTSFGNSSNLSGFLYTATPETPNRTTFNLTSKSTPQKTTETTAKKGNLLVQNLQSSVGKLGITATYQKVDETFQGFQTMRDTGKIDQNVINQLEKQRGTKRTGFAASLPTGKQASLQFSNDKLADTNGAITTQSLSYGSSGLQMNMRTVDNSKDFTHYTDDQTRKESGIKRKYTEIKHTSKFGSLSFNQNSISDNRTTDGGQIKYNAFAFATSNVTFNLNTRDIDKKFTRGNDLAEAERAQLAAERGIKRTNMALNVNLGKGSAFAFNQNNIKDNLTNNAGSVNARALSFTTAGMKLNISNRSIDKSFTRSNDLSEADKAQMAQEVGITRNTTSLSLRTGKKMDKSAAWSSFSESSLGTENSHYVRRVFDAAFGKLRTQGLTQQMDSNFNRINALNATDRAEIAMAARKQFDINAQPGQITQDDIARTYNETGLNRSHYAMQWDDKGYALTASLSQIDPADKSNSGIQRMAYTLNTPKYSLTYNRQDIASKFNRLSSLQPVEIGKYGNEVGMLKNEMGLSTRMFGGNINISRTSIDDSITNSGMSRSSMDYSGNRLKFKVNYLDLPSQFNRINDLSNSAEDKAYLASEAGFQRRDYWMNFQVDKQTNIDTYLYDSANPTTMQERMQRRYIINYAPTAGPKIYALSDQYSSSDANDANIRSYDHKYVNLDYTVKQLGGLLVQGYRDSNTVMEGSSNPSETTVDRIYLQKNFGTYTKTYFEAKDTDYNNSSSYENIRTYGFETPLAKSLYVTSSYTTVNRTDTKLNEENYAYGLGYDLTSKLRVDLKSITQTGGSIGTRRNIAFNVKGLVAKRFGPLSDVQVDAAINTDETRGTQTALNNKTQFQAGLYGGQFVVENTETLNPQNGIYSPSRTIRFDSASDPKRWYHISYLSLESRDAFGKMVDRDKLGLTLRLSNKGELRYDSEEQFDTANKVARTESVTAKYQLDNLSSLSINQSEGRLSKVDKTLYVLPINSLTYKYDRLLNTRQNIYADYQLDQDSTTKRSARTIGAGTKGDVSENSKYEVYYGYTRLVENGRTDHQNIYRASVDYRVNSDHFLVFSAQKKSKIESSTINAEEGDTVIKLDFRSVFN